ncbi:hypothetical protein MTO96_019233 [Rhipicephalus appendiculatus]
MSVAYRCTQYKGSPDACTNCRRPGHRYDVCPHPKSGLCSRCGDKHERQDVPSCIPSCILCGGQQLTVTVSCKARNPTAKRRSAPPQKTKFPTKEDFPPREDPPIYVCMVLRDHQGERHDLPRLGSEGSAGRGKAAQGSLLYLHPNSPSSFTTPIFTHPIRPASSDLEAKFQYLAKNLEARFTERITAQVTAQCQIMIEATITRIMDNVLSSIMTKVEERLANFTS